MPKQARIINTETVECNLECDDNETTVMTLFGWHRTLLLIFQPITVIALYIYYDLCEQLLQTKQIFLSHFVSL